MDVDRVPCLVSHQYEGRRCVGAAGCPSERCVITGHRNRPESEVVALVADGFVRPVKIERYVRCRCADCVHAVDLDPEIHLRSAGGRPVSRWTVCEQGFWRSPCSVWALVNHRVPLVQIGVCSGFEGRGVSEARAEVIRARVTDRERCRRSRSRRRSVELVAV